jgi:hypothetical protein
VWHKGLVTTPEECAVVFVTSFKFKREPLKILIFTTDNAVYMTDHICIEREWPRVLLHPGNIVPRGMNIPNSLADLVELDEYSLIGQLGFGSG